MSDEAEKKLDQILIKVKQLERFTDRQLSRAQLSREWGVDPVTIDNYREYHGLPILKNGKYAWIAVTDWLYDSKISKTKEGKKALKAISFSK